MGNTACRSAEPEHDLVEVVQVEEPAPKRVIPVPHVPTIAPAEYDFPEEKTLTSLPLGVWDEKGYFEDAEFPANNLSLGGVTGDGANPEAAEYLQEMMKLVVPGWVRPHEMMGKRARQYKLYDTQGEPCLFKNVSPRDIEQGYLGDCWLVSSFAAIAEYPDRVRSLFKQTALTEDGKYDVRLYDPLAEEWVVVTIDDRLPYWKRPGRYGSLCFAKPTKENEFWTCLLEKAVAKFVKSYHRLDGGFECVAMEMLTGKPSLCVAISVMQGGTHKPFTYECGREPFTARHATVRMRLEAFDAHWTYFGEDASAMLGGQHSLKDEHFWRMLQTWDRNGCSIACSSRGDYQGILAHHAYTLLRVLEVPITRNGLAVVLKMVHVRNPHRTNEWKGRFCDDDAATWTAFPEALRACNHTIGVKDNGVFWMEWDDFKRGFERVHVNFDKRRRGPRYTDETAQARADHLQVPFGQVGYQKWEGLEPNLLGVAEFSVAYVCCT